MVHTFILLFAGSKVNQLDCDAALEARTGILSHHNVLWL